MLKSFKIYTCTNGALGLHLSRAPWDPYPWVSSIQKDSTSYVAGLRIGDCLLELNGQDVLGLKISEIAALLKNHWLNESSNYVTVVMWRNKCNSSTEGTVEAAVDAAHDDDEEDEENNAHNINQQSLQKFATCLQHIAQLLECPVCLEVIKPPGWQCCNGHVLCNNCRSRSEKCPVCRVPLGPRGRCLLSDKLFTLLADSFPCDGVRSNKNSPKDRRKCSTDFHNQPKMAILQKQQQQQHHHDGEIKAKDFKKIQQNFILTTSSTRRRIKTNSSSTNKMEDGVKEENKHTARHPSMEQTMNDTNFVVNINKGNNSLGNGKKSSLDYSDVATALRPTGVGSCKDVALAATFGNEELLGQTTTIYQCHCITCYKSDKVEIVNNVTTTTATTATTLNKYILQVSATQQGQQQEQEGQACLVQHRQQKEKYQNYQCPTGKLCCLTKNVLPSAAQTTTSTFTTTTTTLTNNKLSTKQTTTESTKSSNAEGLQRQGLQDEECNFRKTLKNEWEVLAHLTEDHHLPVNQYYAEYGQPIAVHCHKQQKTITCLNLRGNNDNSKIDKFLLACIPIEMAGNPTNSNKVAIFIYHMNTLSTTSPISLDDDEVSNFETIIENPLTGIKWFGRAHALTTPWSQIYHKQHFLMHEMLENDDDGGADAAAAAGGSGVSDAFVIVIKTKL